MATRRRRTAAATADGKADAKVTSRLVLRRARVVIMPDGVESPVGADFTDAEVVEAWVVCGEQLGTQTQAIEAYAGKPGSTDAKVGVFKAVPVRNWKGGAIYSQPQLPKVEREIIR